VYAAEVLEVTRLQCDGSEDDVLFCQSSPWNIKSYCTGYIPEIYNCRTYLLLFFLLIFIFLHLVSIAIVLITVYLLLVITIILLLSAINVILFFVINHLMGLTCNVEVLRSSPIKGSRCFLEQETLPLLLSTGWFQERIRA